MAPFGTKEVVLLTPLTQYYRGVLRGNFVSGATSFWSTTTGNITISGIPAGASIVKALLFWGCECNSASDLANINFNGTPITGSVVGSTSTLCWGTSSYLNYVADVTALVSGNGTYTISVPSSLPTTPGADGASLYVVYCEGSEPIRTISIYAGAEHLSILTFTSYSWTQSGFTATVSPQAKASFTGGDCQDGSSNTLYFNSSFVYTCDGSTPGNHYGFWEADVSSLVSPSATSVNWQFNSSGSDCVSPNVSVISITSVDPETYTCTAGYDDPISVDENGNIYASGEIEVYNIIGQRVSTSQKLPKGIYFIKGKRGIKRVILR